MLVEHSALDEGNMSRVIDDLPILDAGETTRRNMIGAVLRNYNEVRVRYAEAVDDHSNPKGFENVAHAAPDALRHEHNSLCRLIVEVSEVIHVCLGNHQTLARG